MALFLRLVAASVVFVSSSALATVACFQQSPRFTQEGDRYWQINTIPQGPVVGKQAFLKQAEPFKGRISGTVQREECSGAQANPLIKATKASLKGSLSIDADGVKLQVSVTDLKDKTIKEERLEFLGRSPTVALNTGAEGEFSLIQKLRANANPGDKISLLRESEYSLVFAKKQISIRAVYFANGLAYAEEFWEIMPR